MPKLQQSGFTAGMQRTRKLTNKQIKCVFDTLGHKEYIIVFFRCGCISVVHLRLLVSQLVPVKSRLSHRGASASPPSWMGLFIAAITGVADSFSL